MFEVSAEKEETLGLKYGIALTSINGLNTVLLLKVDKRLSGDTRGDSFAASLAILIARARSVGNVAYLIV